MRRLPVAILLAVTALATAQQPEGGASVGLIVYGEGDEVTIIREQRLIRLDAVGEVLGEPLLPGDQITTADATYLEIQFLTSRNLVKVSENTTFLVEELSGDGTSRLQLAYGRIRSQVEQLSGNQRFEIRGTSAVAGVRGTDFAFDQVIDPTVGEVLERVYAFEGEVVVGDADAEIVIGAGELASIAPGRGLSSAPEAISEELSQYWAGRDFVRAPRDTSSLKSEFPRFEERLEEAGRADVLLGPLLGEPETQPEPSPDSESDPAETPEPALQPEPSPQAESTGTEAAPLPESTDPPVAEAAAEPELDDEPARSVDQTDPENARTVFRTTGVVLVATGLTVELAAVGLYYFADDLFTSWSADQQGLLGPIAGLGLGLLAGGLVSLLIGGSL